MTFDPAAVDASRIPSTEPPSGDVLAHAHGPATVLKFLDDVVADADKTRNAQKLLKSSAAAISRVVLSIGLIGIICITAAVVISNYSGIGTATSGGLVVGATGAVGLAGWAFQRFRRRRGSS